MALLVEYKCEQTNNPSIYTNLAQMYLAYKEMNNISMQDIKTQVREMSNRKHERIALRFEHPCSTFQPSTL